VPAQRLLRGCRPGVDFVEAVATDEQRVDQGHRLEADVGSAGSVAEIDVAVEELAEAEALHQGGGEEEAGVGDSV
jgi:hypothetical protein